MIGDVVACPNLACGCSLTVPASSSLPSAGTPAPVDDIIFNCSHCQHELIVDKEGVGLEVACPKCAQMIVIPKPAASVSQPTDAPSAWRPPPPPPLTHSKNPRPPVVQPPPPVKPAQTDAWTPPPIPVASYAAWTPPAPPTAPRPLNTGPRTSPAPPPIPCVPPVPQASYATSSTTSTNVQANQFKLPSIGKYVNSIMKLLTDSGRLKSTNQDRISEEIHFRRAVSTGVKGIIIILALLFLQVATCVIFHMRRSSWVEFAISLVIVGFLIRLYWPIKSIVTFYLAAWMKMRKGPEPDNHIGNIVAATENVMLLVLVLCIYLYLIPALPFRTLSTVFNVMFILVAIGILFLVWKSAQPLIDLLTGHITDTVATLSCGLVSIDCPACKATNDQNATFCISCGAAIERKSPETPIPTPPISKGRCPKCSAENPPAAKFCHQCGNSL